MIEIEHVSKSFGAEVRRERPHLERQRRRGIRIPRPQRRGQDHDDQDDRRAAAGPQRDASSSAAGKSARTSRPSPSSATSPISRYLYEKLTGREFLRFIADIYRLERSRAAGADRGGDRDIRTRGLRRPADRRLLARDEAAHRRGRGASPRPEGRRHRRADGGARPAKRAARQGHPQGPGARGRDRSSCPHTRSASPKR